MQPNAACNPKRGKLRFVICVASCCCYPALRDHVSGCRTRWLRQLRPAGCADRARLTAKCAARPCARPKRSTCGLQSAVRTLRGQSSRPVMTRRRQPGDTGTQRRSAAGPTSIVLGYSLNLFSTTCSSTCATCLPSSTHAKRGLGSLPLSRAPSQSPEDNRSSRMNEMMAGGIPSGGNVRENVLQGGSSALIASALLHCSYSSCSSSSSHQSTRSIKLSLPTPRFAATASSTTSPVTSTMSPSLPNGHLRAASGRLCKASSGSG